MNQNWIALIGSAEVNDSEISLNPQLLPSPPITPAPPANPEAPPPPPFATLRSNIDFDQGTITCEIKISEMFGRCYIGLNVQQGGDLYIGLNNLGAPYGMALWRNGVWEPVAGTGHGSFLRVEHWYRLKIDVRGSNIDMFIDDVKVLTVSQQLEKGPLGLLMQSWSRVSVRNIAVTQVVPECFIVMQFTEEYNALYREVIKPTCEKFGYRVVRADDTYTSGLIINDIVRSIQESTIVIADITPNNPNVFYEVGYAHGIGKTTILLSDKKREKLPFDVSGFRTLFYDNSIAGKRDVEERLQKHLEQIQISSVARLVHTGAFKGNI